MSGSWPLPVGFRLVVRDGEFEANAVMAAAVLIARAREPQVFERLAKPLPRAWFFAAAERVGGPAFEQIGGRVDKVRWVSQHSSTQGGSGPVRRNIAPSLRSRLAGGRGRAFARRGIRRSSSAGLRPLGMELLFEALSGIGGLWMKGTMLKRRRAASSTLRSAGLWLPMNTSLNAGR